MGVVSDTEPAVQRNNMNQQNGRNQFEPIDNDRNNGDQEQAVQEEEESENDEDETSDEGESSADEGLGDQNEDYALESAELRQTLEDRKRELSRLRAQYTQKINRVHNLFMPVPVAVGGGGGNAAEQINSDQMAHQQVDMRPGRFARVMAWAKTRPQWQHEQEQLRQNAGQASEQELEVKTLMRVMELYGMAPPRGE